MYHNSIGEIWRKGDDIPKTFLKISEIEKNEGSNKSQKNYLNQRNSLS